MQDSRFTERFQSTFHALGLDCLLKKGWHEAAIGEWCWRRTKADYRRLAPADFNRELLKAAILARSKESDEVFNRASELQKQKMRRHLVMPVIRLQKSQGANVWDPAAWGFGQRLAGYSENEALLAMIYLNLIMLRQEGKWPKQAASAVEGVAPSTR